MKSLFTNALYIPGLNLPKRSSLNIGTFSRVLIGGLKCERLTKPVLLEVAKKLGVVGIKNKNKKDTICNALDKIEKGNSNFKIDSKLCKDMKKEQLVSLAISKGIPVNDSDTVKILCQKLQKPNSPNTPNSLANEMEKVLLNSQKKEKRKPTNIKRKLDDKGIKNDEEGETVCSALVNISRQLEVQNKIMIKMLAQLQKRV